MVMDSQNAITICYVKELFTFIYHLYELNTLMWQFVDGRANILMAGVRFTHRHVCTQYKLSLPPSSLR